MKFTKLDLLTLLISLFLFASCKNTNTIGLDPDPATEIQGTLVDTLTVLSKTVPDDTTYTWTASQTDPNLVRHPFGYLNDPEIGTSQASLAMSVNIPNSAYRFGKDAILDSAVLVLPYSTQFYGDTITSVYNVVVRQLKDDISQASSFKSSKTWDTIPAIIGTFNGKIKPTTSFKITDIVAGGPDTLKTVVAQMRVKLDPAWLQNNLVNEADTPIFVNNATFAEAFKGLHVSATATGTGGIMFFNFDGTDSRVEFYYKKPNATTPANTDTVEVNFPINMTTNPVAATIKQTYTTAVKTQLEDVSNKQYETTYLQGLGGLRNKISFPYLKDFYSRFGTKAGTKIIINKAELVIDLSSGTDVSPFTPAPRLSLYRYDIVGRRTTLPDNSTSDIRAVADFGGTYDLTNKKYSFVVTSYLQDLLDGKTKDYGTYLATGSSTELDITPPLTSGARSIIGSSANSSNKVRLNVYYTVVN